MCMPRRFGGNNIQSLVSRFAREQLQPLVRKMDEESQMDKSIITGLFEQGVSL